MEGSNDGILVQLRRYGLPFWSCLLNFVVALVISSTHRYPFFALMLVCFATFDWMAMGLLLMRFGKKLHRNPSGQSTLSRSTYIMYVFSFDAMMLLSGLLSLHLWRLNSVALPSLEAYRSTRLPLHAWLVSGPTTVLISILLPDILRSGLAGSEPAVAVCALCALAMAAWNFLEHGLYLVLWHMQQLRMHQEAESQGTAIPMHRTSFSFLVLYLRVLLELKGRDDHLECNVLLPLNSSSSSSDVEGGGDRARRLQTASEAPNTGSPLLRQPSPHASLQRAEEQRSEELQRMSLAAAELLATRAHHDELTIDGDLLVARFGLEAHRAHLVVVQVAHRVLLDSLPLHTLQVSRMYLEQKVGRALWRWMSGNCSVKLRAFSATRCFATPEFIHYLQQACTCREGLTGLSFFSCDLQDTGMALLASCLSQESSLVNLSLTFEGLTAVGVGLLSTTRAPKVVKLDLRANDVSDDGAEALGALIQNWPALEHLCLSKNNLSCTGAKELANALSLRAAGCLSQLDVSGNNISDEGAWALINSLAAMQSTMILDLSGNALSVECMRELTRHSAQHGLRVKYQSGAET